MYHIIELLDLYFFPLHYEFTLQNDSRCLISNHYIVMCLPVTPYLWLLQIPPSPVSCSSAVLSSSPEPHTAWQGRCQPSCLSCPLATDKHNYMHIVNNENIFFLLFNSDRNYSNKEYSSTLMIINQLISISLRIVIFSNLAAISGYVFKVYSLFRSFSFIIL